MQALYRKYRSQKFSDIIGQDPITKTLANAVRLNRVGHAYIFSGPRGTGKTSTARILAKAVNCVDTKRGEPCNKCSVCEEILHGNAIDIIEIDAASHTGVEDVRNIIEKVEFAPVKFFKKVYIIDEVHMLSKSAFNALLKTLEEPPKHVLFILATTEIHKIHVTILSRCQRFDFKLGKINEIVEYLKYIADSENIKISKSALECVANVGNGSYRDAVTAFDQILSTQAIVKDKIITEVEVRQFLGIPDLGEVELFVDLLINKNYQQSLKIITDVIEKGSNIKIFSGLVLENLRLQLISAVDGSSIGKVSTSDLFSLIKIFTNADKAISSTAIPQLPLELAILEFAGVGEGGKNTKENRSENKNENFPDLRNPKEALVPEMKPTPKKIQIKIHEISIEEVNCRWNSIMKKVKPFNGHLFAFLSKAYLDKVEKNKLYVTVPYAFYKERITDRKSQKILSNIFYEELGVHLGIRCSVGNLPVDKNILQKRPESLVDDAMDVFNEDVV